jgi:hypothetical protein
MLISVHIPKTGGASFRGILEDQYGERLRLDYADRPMTHGLLGRILRTALGRWKIAGTDLGGCQCVHGHFLPIKYRFVREGAFAIWFRDPVELVLSRYYYFKRYLKPDDLQFKRYIKREDLSLDDYVGLAHFHNVYSKYLLGMRLEDFGFVGITEDYGASLEVFRRMFGFPDVLREQKLNANPDKPGCNYEISNELRRRIFGYNKKDLEIYRRAVAINRTLQRRYLAERQEGVLTPVGGRRPFADEP